MSLHQDESVRDGMGTLAPEEDPTRAEYYLPRPKQRMTADEERDWRQRQTELQQHLDNGVRAEADYEASIRERRELEQSHATELAGALTDRRTERDSVQRLGTEALRTMRLLYTELGVEVTEVWQYEIVPASNLEGEDGSPTALYLGFSDKHLNVYHYQVGDRRVSATIRDKTHVLIVGEDGKLTLETTDSASVKRALFGGDDTAKHLKMPEPGDVGFYEETRKPGRYPAGRRGRPGGMLGPGDDSSGIYRP